MILGVLTTTNFLLSYAPLPPGFKFWLFLLGAVAPLGFWAAKKREASSQGTFDQREFLSPLPLWIWIFLFGAAFFARFWRIESLFRWPFGDEGLCGLAGIELSQKWDWRYFYTAGQDPPTLFWICGLFFKFSNSVFFNLWVPAALISCLSVVVGFLAARQFFSRSFSFVCTGLLAFSYWPLYLGRVAFPGAFVLLWWPLTLLVLGQYLKASSTRKTVLAPVLGVVTGLNTFTFTSWPFFAFSIWIAVLFEMTRQREKSWRRLLLFAGGFGIGLLPFLWASFQLGFGQHISDVALWSRPVNWKKQAQVVLNYLSVLGWGPLHEDNYNTPFQGGYLNPVWATFFLLGLVGFFQRLSSGLARWIIGCGLLFLIPGFLTINMDGFRIIQILPLLLVVTAYGCRVLLDPVSRNWRVPLLSLLFLFSLLFDMGRLAQPYRQVDLHPEKFQATGKSLARYRAYQALQTWVDLLGPGIILGEWDIPADRTLEAVTYFNNSNLNPRLDPARSKWLALLTDRHYWPFLEKRFPRASFTDLDADFSKGGNRMLLVIRDSSKNRESLQRWACADRAFRNLNWAIDHIHDRDCLTRVDQDIHTDYPLVRGDPFLESVYWEKAAYFYYYYGGHYPEHLRALQLAVTRGYPAAHLYTELAELYTLGGHNALAQEATQKAQQSETEYPWR